MDTAFAASTQYPGKALCLKLADTPDADEPLMGMCDSARYAMQHHLAGPFPTG
ncbi:hypothetical protein ACFYW8_21920 [Streptomyces sp. NPDC002742]|uniref:hypothetical protein n=1 Tax=Streptomyces sp. NPDC002742 TaxID=3364663 RepID=UPI0036CFE2BE